LPQGSQLSSPAQIYSYQSVPGGAEGRNQGSELRQGHHMIVSYLLLHQTTAINQSLEGFREETRDLFSGRYTTR